MFSERVSTAEVQCLLQQMNKETEPLLKEHSRSVENRIKHKYQGVIAQFFIRLYGWNAEELKTDITKWVMLRPDVSISNSERGRLLAVMLETYVGIFGQDFAQILDTAEKLIQARKIDELKDVPFV